LGAAGTIEAIACFKAKTKMRAGQSLAFFNPWPFIDHL
jgi:hypothetical protein